MDTTGNTIESVPDTSVTASMEEPIPYPLGVATDIWRVVTSMMEEARTDRGCSADIDFDEYLELMDSITAGDLVFFLIDSDKDAMFTMNEWLDDLEAIRPSSAIT